MTQGCFRSSSITRTYDCPRSFTNGAQVESIFESQKRGKGQVLKLTLALKEDESTPKCASCFADGVVDDDKLSAGLFTQKPAVGSKQFGSNSFDLKTCLSHKFDTRGEH
mmetsp:Transcript_5135/g.8750  ORF Transcript_5135/g.8750 Transcript_5135/m.8750 type:complete len:109 (+) Transcript_5135:161-487(+)